MQKIRLFFFLTLGVLLLAGGFFVANLTLAQTDSTDDIIYRLRQKGVTVTSVMALNGSPDEIEINLQSQSTDSHLTLDDHWHILLAQREAISSYQKGIRLKSYQLNVFNLKGEVLYSATNSLHENDLNQKSHVVKTSVNDEIAQKNVAQALQIGNLTVDKMKISREVEGGNDQILDLQLSGKSLEDVNRSVSGLMDSFFQMQETINTVDGANVVLIHLRIVDNADQVLLDYVRDTESGVSLWRIAPGLNDDWFPKPAEAATPVPPQKGTTEPVAPYAYPAPRISTPSEGYPAP